MQAPPTAAHGGLIVPERFSPRIARGFDRWYLQGLFRRSFHAVRATASSEGVLGGLATHHGPAIVVMNHQAWWDPLVGLWLHGRFEPHRRAIAPMEAAQLAKFGFFRRLGIFGVEPDAPGAIDAIVTHLRVRWAQHPATTLWLTPQGTFADVRAPIRLRPGAAAVAARALPDPPPAPLKVVSVSVEYVFALDRRPELCLHAAPVDPPAADANATTADWNRAMTAAMQDGTDHLASLVIARDWAPLPPLKGTASTRASNSRLWDWWLALRGTSGRLEAAQRSRTTSQRPLQSSGASVRPVSAGQAQGASESTNPPQGLPS
jgi:1-acyl-sn-glycerol-3-phosphate acyltransferase